MFRETLPLLNKSDEQDYVASEIKDVAAFDKKIPAFRLHASEILDIINAYQNDKKSFVKITSGQMKRIKTFYNSLDKNKYLSLDELYTLLGLIQFSEKGRHTEAAVTALRNKFGSHWQVVSNCLWNSRWSRYSDVPFRIKVKHYDLDAVFDNLSAAAKIVAGLDLAEPSDKTSLLCPLGIRKVIYANPESAVNIGKAYSQFREDLKEETIRKYILLYPKQCYDMFAAYKRFMPHFSVLEKYVDHAQDAGFAYEVFCRRYKLSVDFLFQFADKHLQNLRAYTEIYLWIREKEIFTHDEVLDLIEKNPQHVQAIATVFAEESMLKYLSADTIKLIVQTHPADFSKIADQVRKFYYVVNISYLSRLQTAYTQHMKILPVVSESLTRNTELLMSDFSSVPYRKKLFETLLDSADRADEIMHGFVRLKLNNLDDAINVSFVFDHLDKVNEVVSILILLTQSMLIREADIMNVVYQQMKSIDATTIAILQTLCNSTILTRGNFNTVIYFKGDRQTILSQLTGDSITQDQFNLACGIITSPGVGPRMFDSKNGQPKRMMDEDKSTHEHSKSFNMELIKGLR